MLAGLGARWKQTVALYFTGDSVNGRDSKFIVEKIIIKAENIGLYVDVVTTDMGPSNRSMWKEFHINASRY